MSEILKNISKKIFFRPAWYAIFVNPYFIARRSLYGGINKFSQTIINKKILDLGCGCKPYSTLFAGSEYVGIDIEGGGHKGSAKNADLSFDGENIPFIDNFFEVIICTQVLEHTEAPEKLIQEANRVLKNGGILFLTCPFVWPEHEVPYDFRRYTQYGLKKILEENNFNIEKILPTTGVFASVGQLLSSFLFELVGKNLFWRLPMAVIVCFPIQLSFFILDFLFRHKGLALDYVVIAKKYVL